MPPVGRAKTLLIDENVRGPTECPVGAHTNYRRKADP
jgi:hypothetical protein